MKKNWQAHASHLHQLIGNTGPTSKCITLYQDCVGSNVALTPLQALLYVGQDDKSNVLVGRHMLIAATACQYASTISPSQKLSADLDFTNHNVEPSVTLIMDITGTAGESVFNGVVEVSEKVSLSLHMIQRCIPLMD